MKNEEKSLTETIETFRQHRFQVGPGEVFHLLKDFYHCDHKQILLVFYLGQPSWDLIVKREYPDPLNLSLKRGDGTTAGRIVFSGVKHVRDDIPNKLSYVETDILTMNVLLSYENVTLQSGVFGGCSQ